MQKAAVYFACFGMAMCILTFITTFFEFDWYSHRKGVDVGALLGLFLYLAVGVLIHYYVIYGVKKQLSRYLLPFIAVYSVVCTFEVFMCLALLFKMVEPDTSIKVQVDNHPTTIEVKNPPYTWILLGMLIIVCIQGMMLAAVLRCRQFLSQKQEHELALKVAEKSKQEFPSIQVVVATQNSCSSNGIQNGGGGFASPFAPSAETTGNEEPAAEAGTSSSPVGTEPMQNGKQGTPQIQNLI